MSFLQDKEPSLFQRHRDQEERNQEQEQKKRLLDEFVGTLKSLAEDKDMLQGQQGILTEVLGYLTNEWALANLRDKVEVRQELIQVLERATALAGDGLMVADKQMGEIEKRMEQKTLIDNDLKEESKEIGRRRDFLNGLHKTLEAFKSFLQRF